MHPAERLRALETKARKRFGQNFLVHDAIADNLVAASGVRKGEHVLEIGPGLGVLTRALLRAGAKVTAIELDRDLAGALKEDLPEITLIEGDAMRVDIPEADRIVANLPYNVGTQILLRLLPYGKPMALMFQKEVGERICARPRSKEYGSLSVTVQVRAAAEILVDLGPGAFHPPPKVRSVVVGFRPRTPDFGGVDGETFERVLRAGFSARRKTLENAFAQLFGKETAHAALVQCGIDPGARAETLDVNAWRLLAAALGPTLPIRGR